RFTEQITCQVNEEIAFGLERFDHLRFFGEVRQNAHLDLISVTLDPRVTWTWDEAVANSLTHRCSNRHVLQVRIRDGHASGADTLAATARLERVLIRTTNRVDRRVNVLVVLGHLEVRAEIGADHLGGLSPAEHRTGE